MQQIKYFKSAWGDIKNSPGWFGKLCLLALVSFIPVFGSIVVLGYVYGWAREIAWGTHEPMPTRIFGNEDGKLYRRGWFVLVLMFVVALVSSVVMGIGSSMQGAGLWGVAANSHAAASSIFTGIGLLVYLVGLVGFFFLSVLAWIGSMRISIYDRLSSGFQVGKIWKMFRHDTNGALRIFGMYLIVFVIIVIILSIVYTILMFLIVFAGVAGLAASGYNLNALQHMSDAQALSLFMQFVASAGIVGFFGILVVAFLSYLANSFCLLLVARAMGYWTMQFDVPHWRGQDDPMPFETAPPVPGAMPVNPVSPMQTPYNAYGQQPMQPGQPAPMQQTQPVQPSIPVAAAVIPVAPADESPEMVEDAYAEPVATDPLASDEVEAVQADDSTPAQPVDSTPAPTIAPGELAGFTYSGAPAPAPSAPVTPSGANPAEETVPDLLVVVPETPPAPEESSAE